MIVRVLLPRALAEHADGQRELEITVSDGATLEEVIKGVTSRYPAVGRRIVDETGELRRHVNVYVGTEECRRVDGLATVVPAGVEVSVIGSISGG